MDSGSRKPLSRRALIELIVAAALIVAAPTLVVTQAGQANAPSDDMWIGDWISPFDYDAGLDPRSAALHERAAASVRRMTKAYGDMKLAGDL